MADWKAGWGALCALVVASCVFAGRAEAFDRYNDGCQNCHGHFANDPYTSPKGETWPTSLHSTHRDSGFMDTDCGVCHRGAGGKAYPGEVDGTPSSAKWLVALG